jgi:DNA-binding MarR family transcriptional regulator
VVTTSTDPVQDAWALMHAFVEAHHRHRELADALGFRLGGGRGKVLVQLRAGPMTLGQLAAVTGTDAPYATLIVDKLQAHGLVERRPHPQDRRRKLVTLTAAGRDAIATADAIVLRPPEAMRTLSADDLGRLTGILTRVLEADRTAMSAPAPDPSRRNLASPALGSSGPATPEHPSRDP